MAEDTPDFDSYRAHIQNSLNGDLGDDAQEDMIINLFEGHLKHQMNQMMILAGSGVGTMGSSSDGLIWG